MFTPWAASTVSIGAAARILIYWHFPGYLGAAENSWRTTPVGAIRSGDWKLLEFFEDGRLELYNLRDDLSEKNNLATKLPDKVRELHAKLAAWHLTMLPPVRLADAPRAMAVTVEVQVVR